jgi:hypothetical protein
MPRFTGPCNRCGRITDRQAKAGKEHLCPDCGIAKMRDQQTANARREGAAYRAAVAYGAEFQRQHQAREGVYYERWAAAMQRAAARLNATDGVPAATIPAEQDTLDPAG